MLRMLLRELVGPERNCPARRSCPATRLRLRGSGSPESDWDVGSTITVHPVGLTVEDPEQVVRESQPCQRLSYTWHTFTPEWRKTACERAGFTEEFLNRIAAVKRSEATFEIAELGDRVKLTVTHDGFDEKTMTCSAPSAGAGPNSSQTSRLCSRPTRPCHHPRLQPRPGHRPASDPTRSCLASAPGLTKCSGIESGTPRLAERPAAVYCVVDARDVVSDRGRAGRPRVGQRFRGCCAR